MDQIQKSPPSIDASQSTYPSQQEGFIPLDFSSPIHKQNTQSQHNRQHQQTPYYRQNNHRNNFYQNNRINDYQHNNFRHTDDNEKFRRFSDQGNNSRGYFQQNNRSNFNSNRGGRRGNGGHGHNRQKVNVDISQYIHPSMTEDPWRDLVERHNAMKDDDNEDILNKSRNEKSDCTSPSSTDE